MAAIAGASPDAQNEQSTVPLSQCDKLVAKLLYNFCGNASRNLGNFREESRSVSLGVSACICNVLGDERLHQDIPGYKKEPGALVLTQTIATQTARYRISRRSNLDWERCAKAIAGDRAQATEKLAAGRHYTQLVALPKTTAPVFNNSRVHADAQLAAPPWARVSMIHDPLHRIRIASERGADDARRRGPKS
ncbi:MAG: hypothetical protein ACAH24_28425 [Hyphomicrobiaceae bacterium]